MSTASVNIKKDDATWLNFCYIVFGFLIGMIFWNAIDVTGIQTGWQEKYDHVFPYVKNVAAVALGVLSILLVKANPDRHAYYLASIGEVRKVTWPTMPDTRRMTTVVCVVVGIFSIILSLFDMIWGKLLGMLLGG